MDPSSAPRRLIPARARRGRRPFAIATPPTGAGRTIAIDRYRGVVFPNRVREQRLRHAQPTLLAFATAVPDIPYIRLSKIERGEVFARADELARIAAALGVAPADLLIDVDAAGFDIADWFAPFEDGVILDDDEEARMAVLLAAATRALRHGNDRLSAPTIDADYGIPPVILSRIENAQKGLSRWNAQTMAAIVRLFGLADEAALRAHLETLHAQGRLDDFREGIMDARARHERTRRRIAVLRTELAGDMPRRVPPPVARQASDAGAATDAATDRRFAPVYGVALGDGLLAMTPIGTRVEVPAIAGPRAFGVRVCRATLGGGLPGQSTLIADPDRSPQAGGLALVRDGAGHRIVAVIADREGAMRGFSTTPACEIALDPLPPADVAAIVAALYL